MHKILILLMVVLAVNCKSTQNESKMVNEQSVLIAKGNLYGSGEEGIKAQKKIISEEKKWQDLLQKMNSINKVSDSFSETKIDFSKYRVIAVFDDLKTTGGHSIELNIQPNSEAILVDVISKSPEGMATSVMTQPFYIVKIVKDNLPIQFN